jgi:probable phosphoglycerate mutase
MSDEKGVPSAEYPVPREERQPTTLLLVRHGQTDSNVHNLLHGHGDVPLTERGIAQAALIAARLAREVGIVALYASPLDRAHHTARVIGEAIGREPILHRGLMEINFGAVEGLSVEEAWERFPHLRPTDEKPHDPELQWPEGESRRGFRERAYATLCELVARHQGETIVIVAHGGVISAGVSTLLREELPQWSRYQVGNCSLTQLTWDEPDEPPTVVCLDDRVHLGEE